MSGKKNTLMNLLNGLKQKLGSKKCGHLMPITGNMIIAKSVGGSYTNLKNQNMV